MNRKSLLTMAVLASVSSGLLLSGTSFAATADKTTDASSVAATKKAASEKDAIKVSEDAAITMRNIRDARVAIFNGQTERAQTLVDAAVTRVKATREDADKYAIDIKDKRKANDTYVPFAAMLTVGEGLVPEKHKTEHVSKTNHHASRSKKDDESFKLVGIDMGVTTQLVPVKLAEQHIQDASKLVDGGKYYQANLQLKAVEDSVLMQTVAVDGTPMAKHKDKAS